MAEHSENLTLVYLRRLDANVAAIGEDVADLKQRFTTAEVKVSYLAATKASRYGQTAICLDRIEHRLERLERHADILSA